jgi:hypothetical protein
MSTPAYVTGGMHSFLSTLGHCRLGSDSCTCKHIYTARIGITRTSNQQRYKQSSSAAALHAKQCCPAPAVEMLGVGGGFVWLHQSPCYQLHSIPILYTAYGAANHWLANNNTWPPNDSSAADLAQTGICPGVGCVLLHIQSSSRHAGTSNALAKTHLPHVPNNVSHENILLNTAGLVCATNTILPSAHATLLSCTDSRTVLVACACTSAAGAQGDMYWGGTSTPHLSCRLHLP